MSGTEHEISELLTALSKMVVASLSFFAAFGFRRADMAEERWDDFKDWIFDEMTHAFLGNVDKPLA